MSATNSAALKNTANTAPTLFGGIKESIFKLLNEIKESILSDKSFFYRYLVAFICLIFSGVVYKLTLNNPQSANSNYYMYLALIMTPFLIATIVIFPTISTSINVNISFVLLLIFVVSIIAIGYFAKTIQNADLHNIQYVMYGLSAIIAIFFLAIVYKVTYRFIRNTTGLLSLILNLLFLIPCMIIDLIELLSKDFKITSNAVKLLAMVEILAIYAYIKIRGIGGNANEILLLGDPDNLQRQKRVGTGKIMFISPEDSDYTKYKVSSGNNTDNNGQFRLNSSISMWIYINTSHTTHGKPTPVYLFGSDTSGNYISAYPLVEYDPTQQQLKVSINKQNHQYFEIDGQKWNYLAIALDENKANIFLNGKLMKTVSNWFTNKRSDDTAYTSNDLLYTGWNSPSMDGVEGAICNVRYYKKTLMPDEIARHYNLYAGKNPPI